MFKLETYSSSNVFPKFANSLIPPRVIEHHGQDLQYPAPTGLGLAAAGC